jgi:hypothetical protein
MNAPNPIEIEKNEVELVAAADSLDNYAKLAESVGFFAEDIVLYRLRAHLRSAGLSEYPLEDVEKFLDKKFGKATTTVSGSSSYPPIKYATKFKWGWHPLRAVDAKEVSGWQIGATRTVTKFDDEFYDSGRHGKYQCTWSRKVLSQPYNRLIPMPVLQTVAGIADKFPSVSFIVADWADYETSTIIPSSRPEDPFLGVLGPGISLMIIERWDEPNFR